jgi:hypothetical protein
VEASNAAESDHEIIEWQVDMKQLEEAEGRQVVGWNLAAKSQESEEQVDNLWKDKARGKAYLGGESTGDEVESEAEWCQESLSKVLDTTAKKIMICARSNRWCNGDI